MNKKVTHTEMNTLPEIWAIDFDGTLVQDNYPEIGEPDEKLFEHLIEIQKRGIKLILWTCRDNDTEQRCLDKAVEFCKSKGLIFDAVNCNIKETQDMFSNDTRKVYANYYLDDKAIPHKAKI